MSYYVSLCILTYFYVYFDIQDSIVISTTIISYIYIIIHKNIESLQSNILYQNNQKCDAINLPTTNQK